MGVCRASGVSNVQVFTLYLIDIFFKRKVLMFFRFRFYIRTMERERLDTLRAMAAAYQVRNIFFDQNVMLKTFERGHLGQFF